MRGLLDFLVTSTISSIHRSNHHLYSSMRRAMVSSSSFDEPKLDQPKPTLVDPELDQQQVRSSRTVVQHDSQEPSTARCFDLSGPTPSRACHLRRPDTARCPVCLDPTTHRARSSCRSTPTRARDFCSSTPTRAHPFSTDNSYTQQ